MCHPLSCCHRRSASPLATSLHHLVRLLLASDAPQELLSHQTPRLHARLDAYWARLHATVARTFRLSQGQAQAWVEQVLTALLHDDCCRAAVRRCVSLAQALGLGPGRGNRLRWATQVQAARRQQQNRWTHAY